MHRESGELWSRHLGGRSLDLQGLAGRFPWRHNERGSRQGRGAEGRLPARSGTQAATDISSIGSRTEPTQSVRGRALQRGRLIFAWRRAHRLLALVGGCLRARGCSICAVELAGARQIGLPRGGVRRACRPARPRLQRRLALVDPGRALWPGTSWKRDMAKFRRGLIARVGVRHAGQPRAVSGVRNDERCLNPADSKDGNFDFHPAGYPAEKESIAHSLPGA